MKWANKAVQFRQTDFFKIYPIPVHGPTFANMGPPHLPNFQNAVNPFAQNAGPRYFNYNDTSHCSRNCPFNRRNNRGPRFSRPPYRGHKGSHRGGKKGESELFYTTDECV